MALSGVKVVEVAGLAPAPFAGLCLADFGAEVVRVDRVSKGVIKPTGDLLARGKKSIALDLKSTQGKQVFKEMIKQADVLIEPFRPGVMEKLGLVSGLFPMKRSGNIIVPTVLQAFVEPWLNDLMTRSSA